MVSTIQRRLQQHNRYLITAAVVMGLLLADMLVGRRISAFKPGFVAAATLSLVGLMVVLWKMEAAIALLGFLPMFVNPAIFDVQGREINTLHLLAGLIIIAWLLRKIVVERDLRLPKSQLNVPLLALVVIWFITWIAGYTFWDMRVPTAHRQPLFFVAEFGQLLLFVGVFWAVADTVRSNRWAKVVCAAIIFGRALTPFLSSMPLWIQLPIALALTCSLLAFERVSTGTKAMLLLALAVFLWDMIQINRIPIYLAGIAVVLVVSFLKSRRLFALVLIIFAVLGMAFIQRLWNVEASVSSRLELARLAWSIFQDHPVLGVGPTHYRSYAILYHHGLGWHTVESGLLLPHDVWLYFLANVGAVGFLGILWVVGSMFWGPFSTYRRAEDAFSRSLAVSALACVAGVVVQSVGGHAAFLPDYDMRQVYMVPVWILTGLMTARRQGTIEEQDD